MKKIIFIVCIAAMSFASCSKYDDVALWNKSMNMDSRISDLEALCQQLNGEIQSLQTIVEAAQSGDYITSVVPVMQDGEEIGYTISFATSAPITIYHGKDGADGKYDEGYTPQIGVKQDTDGHYYWTLDGEWLAGNDGQKILAEGKEGREGTDGNDGVTPQLKIEDAYWFISYDNGLSWQKLGKAVGENGKDGDSFFKSVDNSNSDFVIFTLSDGTEIKLPKYSQLAITFDIEDDTLIIASNSTKEVAYTIASSIADVEIEVVASSDIKAKAVKSSVAAGVITVTTGSSIDDDSHILVFVSNGEKTIMKRLDIAEEMEEEKEEELEIPDNMELAFPDPIFRAYVLKNFDKDNDGKISKEEAALVRYISVSKTNSTPDNEKIATLEGIQYFTNLTSLACYYNKLTSVDLSNNKALIFVWFYENRLTTLDVSKNTELTLLLCPYNQLTSLDVSNNTKLTSLDCSQNQITDLNVSQNTKLERLSCSNNKLTTLNVSRNTELTSLTCSYNQLKYLDITENKALTKLSCAENTLDNLDLSKNANLTSLYCRHNNITELNVSKTDLGNTADSYIDLDCLGNPLNKLYVKQGWSVNSNLIPKETEITYVN